jgi:NAD(P)H-dependent flavin oxidoreductase YrpB (nitropropane dioxygenase family)
MTSARLCRTLGIEFPLLAFSHCRDVVAAVSRAGGMGVFGASSHTPEQLERELAWIDDQVEGKPYGVDILMPENLGGGEGMSARDLVGRIPEAHWQFARDVLASRGVPLADFGPDDPALSMDMLSILPEMSAELLNVAFRHPIRLIANALGVPPASMLDRARAAGVPVAALVGAKEHALRQAVAGVDIVVAQGSEAGGHCGEVPTMVLLPEVAAALRDHPGTMVVAAGGIVTGRQMAASLAMGASGVWTGSVWLATSESEASQVFQEKMIAATSRQTIRSRSRTGKPSRQLRSDWTDAWEQKGSPDALPMPLQQLISIPAFDRIDKAAQGGGEGPRSLVTYFVGQGVGLIDNVRTCRQVVEDFMAEFVDGCESVAASLGALGGNQR